VVGELKDCRQISETHWQGILPDGTTLQVQGTMRQEALACPAWRVLLRAGMERIQLGFIRLIPAAA
jgi:hypothetical protein